MNRIEYLQTGGFPLDSNNLNFLQESFKIMQAFGYFAGDLVIISGCQQTGSTIANGVIFINGEVLEFRGGNIGENVIIREEAVSGTFEDGSFKPIEITRYASFGTSTTNYPWVNFKRGFPTAEIPAMRDALQTAINTQSTRNDGQDNTLTALLARIEALEKRKSFIPVGLVAIWNKTSDVPLPEGWKECTDLRGRMPLGYDPNDGDFNTLGNTGGEKSVTLSISQLPRHSFFTTANQKSWTWGPGGGQNLSIQVDMGGLQNYYLSGTNGEPNIFPTNSVGGNEGHNNMPPYRVIMFIEYVG